MKILFLLCDMLRANRLKTFDPNISRTSPLDSLLESLGGTVFTNCYTPAPDTPRSLACLYTGRYPKYNGCEKRIQWPMFYLRESCETIFDVLFARNFTIVSSLRDVEIEVGTLPEKHVGKIINYSSIDALFEARSSIQDNDNLLMFLTLNDYHDCVSDYRALGVSDARGNFHLSNSLAKILTVFSKDTFDYIFIFSDHGCKLKDDDHWGQDLYLLNDDRSKIVMFVHRRGADYKLDYVSDMTSIMDVLPTIKDILSIASAEKLDGISLFRPSSKRFLVLEDHSIFTPTLGSYHDLWGVRDSDYFYLETLFESLLLKVDNSSRGYVRVDGPETALLPEIRSHIHQHACSYEDVKKQHKILQLYRGLESLNECYSDGTKRPSRFQLIYLCLLSGVQKLYRRYITS